MSRAPPLPDDRQHCSSRDAYCTFHDVCHCNQPGHCYLSAQRLAHLVARGAALTGISPPIAARPLYGFHPATPFAATVAQATRVTDL